MYPSEIINKCTYLRDCWTTRKKKFEDWFSILLLEDKLAQEGMESVVSNDPKTGYNLAKHLLTSMVIADKISNDDLSPEYMPATAYMERYMAIRWKDQERRYRSIGRQSWMGELVGWMLSLGWYSVFAMVDEKEVWAEVWSPYDCFPAFGPDGLVEHARIYTLPASAANKKIKQMNWQDKVPRAFTVDVTFYDYWGYDLDGDIVNAIVADNLFVKNPVKDMAVNKVGRLPIFSSAVGGLPDMGSIMKGNKWQEHYGESIVATNEDLTLQYNKMRSFMQQAARTAAQPHWLELSTGDTPIATDELMNRWGSVLHGSPGEDVRSLSGVSIPIEITNALMVYRDELQRGLFPASLFGLIQQQISYLTMANIASSAMQVLTPYKDAVIGVRTDINNFWQDMIFKNGFAPHRFKSPEVRPDLNEMRFEVDADLEIPGHLVQKATVARMMNPNFRLPVAWIQEKLFPEILDPKKSMADVRAEDALMNPKAILVDNIIAYREQARILRQLEDVSQAELYEKLAKSLEAELDVVASSTAQAKPGAANAPIPKELSGGIE
ncbi:MAG: hypothetical protein WC364_05735 [Eubacteriales bacterium]